MYFIVYKTTNIINNKVYVGIHKTKDLNDGYLGSGTVLRRAVKKYGKENFNREILHHCSSIEETLVYERKIVTEDFVKDSNTYNICCGGMRGPIEETRLLALEACAKQKQKRLDKYNANPKLCKLCLAPLLYKKKRDIFCSSSCSASHNNTNRENIWTEERKKALSVKMGDCNQNTKYGKIRERRNQWREQNEQQTALRIEQLQQFLPVKRGWVTKASLITGIEKSWVKRWIKNNIHAQFKEFYPNG